MILTEPRELTNPENIYARAGKKQEDAVAFYLRRAFGASEDVFVFNDLALKHEGEAAQIDHLIVHTFGFVIIESKSITGEVKVNSQGEWSRSYKGSWSGMASPIIQAQLQGAIFKELLKSKTEELLDKMLMGLVQAGFGAREIAIYCAVSNNAILHRDAMPNKIQKQVVKAEALVEILKKKCSKIRGHFSSDPDFKMSEIQKICDFLMEQNRRTDLASRTERITKPQTESLVVEPVTYPAVEEESILKEPDNDSSVDPGAEVFTSRISCKYCGESSQLTPSSGRFGYYLGCVSCGKNTPLKHRCLDCGEHTVKISKRGDVYSATCGGGHGYRVL